MSVPLLATKLYFPPGRASLVARSRLIERLQRGLQCPLTLISAPPGYGKTTLLSAWRAEDGRSIPTAWLSLDADDNDPTRFLAYLIGALDALKPGQGQPALALLESAHRPPAQSILAVLLGALAELEGPFVLVLDDYHSITAEPVHVALAFLLEHQPPQMHTVLVTRTDPPLPLARLRARSQLVDIRAEHLRFTPDEAATFLTAAMGLPLSAADVAAMEARTEGWIAGLQLAALSMQGSQDVHAAVTALSGTHHYIMDYLTEEVLKLQPAEVRSFLLQTSLLDRMCGPLCDAVLEEDARDAPKAVESQVMLENLERANLFLIPLDDERCWYRYHHLFADVLNRRLERLHPQHLPELNRRASRWYEQNGFIPEATRHALMAGEPQRASLLVEQNACALLMRGEATTLLRWIEAVEPHARQNPWLAVQKAWALLLTGQLERTEPALQATERLAAALEPGAGLSTIMGVVAAARAQLANRRGDTDQAVSFSRRALEQLSDGSAFTCSLRSVVTSIVGDTSRLEGNLDEARRAYAEAASIGQAADSLQMVIVANSDLAGVLVEQGQLRQAARIYSQTLELAARPDRPSWPLAEKLYAGLSRIAYEWNQLDAATQYVQRCSQLCRQWGNQDLEAICDVVLARIERAQGRAEKAQEAMRAAERLASEHSLSTRQSIWVQSALARLWLAQGDVERVQQLVQHSGIQSDDAISYLWEPEYLVLLALLIAQGNHDAALALSERLLGQAEAAGRTGRAIEALVLQALAWQGKQELPQALQVLAKAIALAQPEGYARVFLDEGQPMARLLYRARAQRMGGAYAGELLLALARADGTAPPPDQSLIEPLSARELVVLELIAAGLSNQQIAARLVISSATVKRHISNVYGKLGAASRTQAVSLARELGLLG